MSCTTIAHLNLARGYRGGERQTQLLIQALEPYELRQVLVARRGELLAARCGQIQGLEVREVSTSAFSVIRALNGIDLVHVHEGRSLRSAFMNMLLRHTPYLLTRRIQKGPRNTPVNRLMYRRAEGIVTVSSAIRRSLGRLDLNLPVRVIPDAGSRLSADPGRVADIRAAIGGGFLIGHIGELDESHKGQNQIIEIARRLQAELPELRFVLVGGGRDEARLKTASSGLSNVVFTGFVDDVGNYLAAFDAFIYPSRHEGLGSILIDALEFGLPLIATDVGGIPEIVESGTNGILCKVDDIDALADAVRRICQDGELCDRFASENRNAARKFLPSFMAAQYTDVYKKILGLPGKIRSRA